MPVDIFDWRRYSSHRLMLNYVKNKNKNMTIQFFVLLVSFVKAISMCIAAFTAKFRLGYCLLPVSETLKWPSLALDYSKITTGRHSYNALPLNSARPTYCALSSAMSAVSTTAKKNLKKCFFTFTFQLISSPIS